MFKTFLAVALLVSGLCAGAFAAQDIKESEINNFKRHLLPLPHEITLEKKVTVAPEKIGITLTENAGQAGRNAAGLLAQSIKDKTGKALAGGGFDIVAGLLDDDGRVAGIEVRDCRRLGTLPNSEQAYVIQPAGENRLVVAALNDRGLFYGLTTLRQLLDTEATKDSVAVPLVTIVDWPDLKERGLWNGSSGDIIPFLSSIKVNFDTTSVALGKIARNEKVRPAINNAYQQLAKKNAFNLCPKITHLNFFYVYGLFKAHPELAGKGEQAFPARGGWDAIRARGESAPQVPCASNPLLKKILTEVMEGLAEQGVRDATAWTSEWLSNCECDECRKLGYRLGQFELEAKAIYAAWKDVQRKYPDFNIRIFFSASDSIPDMRRVLRSIPNDVRLERCTGAKRVKQTPRDVFNAPPFDEKRKEGARLISYNLPYDTSMPRFKVLAYKDYIENLLRRGYEGGYALCHYPDEMNRDMNAIMMYAIGEWGWNNKGRSAREFGEAWAVREGYEEPEGVGEWFDIVAPVAFDIYGSSIPRFLERGRAVDMVAGRGKRDLVKGVFRYLPALEDIDRDLAACDTAMALANRLAYPSIIHESRAIQGYLRMVREVLNIATWVADAANPTYDERVELQKAMNRLALACYQTNGGLEEWERVAGVDLSHRRRRQPADAAANRRTVDDIADALRSFGVRKPPVSGRQQIGEWTSEDFQTEPRIMKKWDVTDSVPSSGVYKVNFNNASHFSLRIYSVALTSQVGGDPPVESAVDEHAGHTGFHRSKANVYTLTLDRHEPAARYFLIADIEGHPAQDFSGILKHCKGTVWFKPIQSDEQRMADAITALRPLSDEQLAQWRKANTP